MEFTAHTGRLHADGRPLTVVGVNYHPSKAGCLIWRDWDADAVREDFAAMAEAGFTTVRLFVFWRDFEPAAGQPEPKAFARLSEAVAIAAEHGLTCILSVFTIFMNGRLLDLAWREGRSLWRDPEMRDHEEAFARRVARAVRDHGNVLAFDLGDEISAVAPAEADGLSRDEVASWYARLAGALREEAPGTLVLQANNALSVFGPSPFAPDNAAALDVIAIHGFPSWAAGSIESTLSYKATNLNAFLARYAAAYGVPLVDEVGSYGVDEATAAAYLGASAASALANGASGVLAWCWQDIASTEEPYASRPAERIAGLRRLDGSVKPAFERFARLARSAAALAPGPAAPRIAVYLPEHIRARPASYLDHGVGTVAAFYAHLLLKRAHLDY
ncbi:cellulase family glycosylhydrolase, partial [Streptomyces sp. NPDC058953]